MATLDDIPTLPAAGTGLTVDDLVGVINKNDLRSPKKVSLQDLLALFGLSAIDNAEISNTPVILGQTISTPNLRYFGDLNAAIEGGLTAGDIYYSVDGFIKRVPED